MNSHAIPPSSSGSDQIAEAQREQLQKTRDAAVDAAAAALGVSPDVLRQDLASGKSLSDVAAQRGVSPDKVLDAVKSAVKATGSNLSDDQVGQISQRLVAGHHRHHGGHPAEAAPPPADPTLPPGSTISVKA